MTLLENIKYKTIKKDDCIRVTFNNGKILTFLVWSLPEVKFLAKNSLCIQYLYKRTAALGEIDNKVIPSTESNDTRQHFFYIALRNTMYSLTRNGYTLAELLKFEKIIMQDKLDKAAIMYYALEKDTKENLADVIRLHSYR